MIDVPDPSKSEALDSVGVPCPCCGGTEFGAGPGGRLSAHGTPPRCLKCGSLERNRAIRWFIEAIRDKERFKRHAMLRFSADRAVAGGWFDRVDTNGIAEAFDSQSTLTVKGRYGFVICLDVLDRVANPRRAVAELVKILEPDGMLILSYPSPSTRPTTEDWGFPDPKRHGTYRIFGKDFEDEFSDIAGEAHVVAVTAPDPVTQSTEQIYIITPDFSWVRKAISTKYSIRLLT